MVSLHVVAAAVRLRAARCACRMPRTHSSSVLPQVRRHAAYMPVLAYCSCVVTPIRMPAGHGWERVAPLVGLTPLAPDESSTG